MAQRGRKPKPTAVKVLEGNPGKRSLNTAEPKPEKKAPRCPSWLEDEAKKEWKRMSKQLEQLGILTEIDMAAFAGYCQAYARWKEAEEFITQHGTIVKTPSGYWQQVPQVSIAQTYLKIMNKFCEQFGLTPSARSRIVADTAEDKESDAVNFINCLKHTKGKWRGVPFELLSWQDEIIRTLFGTVKENGYRQYNTCYCEIPKKNGKSELAAAIALYMTCGDGEWGAEVYGCASDRQQASIVFDVAVDMVDQCPALKKRIKPVMSVKRLVYKPTNSFYQVLSAEAYTKHGLNVHAVIFDELHAQPNRELFDVMTKGSGDARTQPLYFLITTAGTDRNSICFEQHQKAVDIIEGRKIDPTFYPVIYGASDEDDWTSEATWYKANPSLGETIDIEKVRNAYISARENAAEENIFRQLRLNQWVKQSTRWMQMDKWDACAFPVNEEELIGRTCYGGLDLSSTSDITAFVLVFPPRNDEEKYIILPYCWIPEDNMRLRVRRDHVPYDVWAAEGSLETTEGNVIHYGFIEKFIEELGTKYHIKEIAFDRWGATQMVQDLEGMGFTVVPFGQGYKDMSPPTKELMKLTLEERIAHGGHKVLRWMMDNVYVRQDPAGNIKMDKEKSTEKIDAAVATVMALDRAIRNQGSDGSVYDARGILVF